jgi:erythromycin esterase
LPSETAPSGAAELVTWLEERKPRLTAASSGDKFAIALQAARVAHQADTLRRGGAAFSYRDEMMARNVEWLANEAYPGQKIVLWAHNGHVTRDGRAYKAMGDWLSKSFPSMYVLGFAVHTGEVRAVTVENGKRIGLAVSPMPAAPDGSGTAILSAAGHPAFFLDLRTQDGELRDWLGQPHSFRSCGSQWNRDDPDRQLTSETLAKAYDGLVFLEKTTAARGLR